MGKCKECKYFKSASNWCACKKRLTHPNNICGDFLEDPILTLATLSDDEIAACLEVVDKIRAEKKKATEIEVAKTNIFIEVNKAIYQIGLEETKKILRQINRDLRDMPTEEG